MNRDQVIARLRRSSQKGKCALMETTLYSMPSMVWRNTLVIGATSYACVSNRGPCWLPATSADTA